MQRFSVEPLTSIVVKLRAQNYVGSIGLSNLLAASFVASGYQFFAQTPHCNEASV